MAPRPKRSADGDDRFFTALENAHSVATACRAAGYTPASVYRWRKEAADFASRWADALIPAGDLLEAEADRRGRDGYDVPVFFRGKKVGAKRRYSDGLLHARLKAVLPHKYRDRAPLPPEAPRVQTVIVRDFLFEYEITRLLDIGKITRDDLEPAVREAWEKRQKENAMLDPQGAHAIRPPTPLSYLSHEGAQMREKSAS